MLVHSLSPAHQSFDDYETFDIVMGVSVESGQLTDVGMRSGRLLLLVWLSDTQ